LVVGLDAAQVGFVRAFVAETWRLLGCEEEVAEDARLVASEAFAELAARGSDGIVRVEITATPGVVTTRLEVQSTAVGRAERDHASDGRRRVFIAALMPDVEDHLDDEPPSLSFSAPRPS